MTKTGNSDGTSQAQREQTTAEFMDELSTKELLTIRRKCILNSVLLVLITIAFEVYAATIILPYAREGVLFTLMGVVFLGTLIKLFINGHRLSLATKRLDAQAARKNFD